MALKLRRGGLHWEQPFPEAEDEVSMAKHKDGGYRMRLCEKNPDQKKLEDRMALTFSHRRRLMNKSVPLTEVRAEYPSLFSFKQVLLN